MSYIVVFQIKYFGKIKYFSYLPTLPLIIMVTGNRKLISLGLIIEVYPRCQGTESARLIVEKGQTGGSQMVEAEKG